MNPCKNCDKNSVILEILGRPRNIDNCIAPLVKALNSAGLVTIASCCGHGKQPGSIVFVDGREIRIFKNYNDARKVDKLFPPIYIN